MAQTWSGKNARFWIAGGTALVLAAGFISAPAGRRLAGRFFRSLRVQKVQAVSVDLTPFTDPNANPSLHEMVAKMISEKVVVTANAQNQAVTDVKAASQLTGFDVRLLRKRKDVPKLMVISRFATNITVDRARLQAILQEAGHPELNLPQSLDGATVSVEIPSSVRSEYGNCPAPTNAANAVANNLGGAPPASMQYSDCVRLLQGPSPLVNVPPGLDIEPLAEIGLEVTGMSPKQAHDFLQTVNWQSTLVMSVPRFVRSYEAVKVNGADGTLLTMAGRRGPGYTLVWAKDGIGFWMEGFGDPNEAVELAESLR